MSDQANSLDGNENFEFLTKYRLKSVSAFVISSTSCFSHRAIWKKLKYSKLNTKMNVNNLFIYLFIFGYLIRPKIFHGTCKLYVSAGGYCNIFDHIGKLGILG